MAQVRGGLFAILPRPKKVWDRPGVPGSPLDEMLHSQLDTNPQISSAGGASEAPPFPCGSETQKLHNWTNGTELDHFFRHTSHSPQATPAPPPTECGGGQGGTGFGQERGLRVLH